MDLVSRSQKLLEDTIAGNSDEVVKAIGINYDEKSKKHSCSIERV